LQILKKIIKTVKLNIKYLYAGKNYVITILKPDVKLFARKVTLEIIFQNLITNSIKYAKANSPAEIVIDINEYNVISVKDNGKGISPLIQDKIFTPFFKADKESKLGNGIGLTTCKKLIEANNGKIWLESEPGKGTTFYFTLNTSKE